ncbi:hypothetical protein ACGFYA_16275 [Streptomyces sp. NPDC048305]|uniref:MmyB family transcriptional regulator n=1 Tax=Streptomyces sp. NPDC048305 TaxID=3365532 RepID=UPI003720E69F
MWPRAAEYAALLLEDSEEFRCLWERHEIGVRPQHVKRFIHPEAGGWSCTEAPIDRQVGRS